MTMELAVDIMRNLLQTGLILSIPILGTALVVGLVVSFVQSITSLQEQTLTFVPKLVCVSLAIVISANFILKTMTEFCISMFNLLYYSLETWNTLIKGINMNEECIGKHLFFFLTKLNLTLFYTHSAIWHDLGYEAFKYEFWTFLYKFCTSSTGIGNY